MTASTITAGVGTGQKAFALLGGALAWTMHLLLAYAIAEFGCVAGLGHRVVLAVSLVSWLLFAASAAMIVIAAGALLISCRVRQQARSISEDADERSTAEYVARFGLITNGLFLFIILVQCIPIFFFLRC